MATVAQPTNTTRTFPDPTEDIGKYYTVSNDVLGQGYFAVVKAGTDVSTGERVAIKCVNKEVVEKEDSLQSEINILAMVDHPNIVKMHAMFDTPTHLLIVMELMEGGELYDEINARSVFTEQEAATIIKQLLSALSYLHARNIVHRDLKLENLLLARKGDLTIKLADFGLSKLFNGTSMYTACGTPFYVAPDILMASDDSGYGPSVDMWAVGILLYILLSGRLPFAGDTDEELFENIIQAKLVFKSPQFDIVSAEAKDFISHLLVAEPEERMSADEALEHVFIKTIAGNTPLCADLKEGLLALSNLTSAARLKKKEK